jgi:hypothetical protein
VIRSDSYETTPYACKFSITHSGVNHHQVMVHFLHNESLSTLVRNNFCPRPSPTALLVAALWLDARVSSSPAYSK